MSFSDDLSAPIERDTADVDVLVNKNLYKLRFTALDPLVWATECDKSPIRLDVDFDRTYGYDVRALTLRVAPLSGVLVDGDELIPLRVDPIDPQRPNSPRVDEWADLFAKIDGAAFRHICDAIWQLNEYWPAQAVNAAKKALAGSGKPSASRSNSASPRRGSTGGSPKKPQSASTTSTDA